MFRKKSIQIKAVAAASGRPLAFAEAARALECDESEERFDAALKKVAAHKPSKDRADGGAKGNAKPSKETR
jgi:hypothetical protein